MTNEELDALQALCDGATEAPWRAIINREVEQFRVSNSSWGVCETMNDSDAQFIAAARTAMPALIAEVRRLQAEIDAPPKPLTLEELDAMDNEPVFIQGGDGAQFWIIADKDWMYEIDYDPDFINMEYADPAGHFGLHVLGWRALRHKPNA